MTPMFNRARVRSDQSVRPSEWHVMDSVCRVHKSSSERVGAHLAQLLLRRVDASHIPERHGRRSSLRPRRLLPVFTRQSAVSKQLSGRQWTAGAAEDCTGCGMEAEPVITITHHDGGRSNPQVALSEEK